MRADIKIIKGFEEEYTKNILEPFLSKLQKTITGIGTDNFKSLQKEIKMICKQYGIDYKNLLNKTFDEMDSNILNVYFEDIDSRVQTIINNHPGDKDRILNDVFSQWLKATQTNLPASVFAWDYKINDKLSLSDLIWQNADKTAQSIMNQVSLVVQTGQSAKKMRDQILQTQQQNIKIPQWIKNKIVESNNPEKIVTAYIAKKEKYNAMRVARTEIQRVWRGSIVNVANKLDFVSGMKWNLSGSHPKKDICDDIANADLGLGKGIYPKDAIPYGGAPAHPHCLCHLTSEMEDLMSWLKRLDEGEEKDENVIQNISWSIEDIKIYNKQVSDLRKGKITQKEAEKNIKKSIDNEELQKRMINSFGAFKKKKK